MKKLLKLSAIVFSVAAITCYYLIEHYGYARNGWPSGIRMSVSNIIDSTPTSLERSASPLFQNESCGAAIFNVPEETLADIEGSGLAYFQSSTQLRNRDIFRGYENWQETPVPVQNAENKSESAGLWSGLSCAELDRSFASELNKAVSSRGSYFASNGEATLVVIPQLKVAVYSWRD